MKCYTEIVMVVFEELIDGSHWKNRIYAVGVCPVHRSIAAIIKLDESVIKLVNTKICLGLKVDSCLKWDDI